MSWDRATSYSLRVHINEWSCGAPVVNGHAGLLYERYTLLHVNGESPYDEMDVSVTIGHVRACCVTSVGWCMSTCMAAPMMSQAKVVCFAIIVCPYNMCV